MPTQAERDKADEAFDRVFVNCDDPTLLEGEDLRQTQRDFFVEAKRLMKLLATPRLKKTVRDDIENMALFWGVMSQQDVIETGECCVLYPLLRRTLKQFQEKKVWPIGGEKELDYGLQRAVRRKRRRGLA